MSEPSKLMARVGGDRQVRHAVGIDLGTSSLRLQIAHYDPHGRPVGEPAAVHLPHSERDGVMPAVLQLSASGELLSFGRAAVQCVPHMGAGPAPGASRFVAEFKPCIGQATEDLAAQGRPEQVRQCTNPACPRPGWAWSVSLQYCGFCGGSLAEATNRWNPQFPYAPEEALEYSRILLSEVRLHLERRLNEPLSAATGWQVVAGVPVHWQAGTRASYHQVLAQAFPEADISLLSEPEGALRYYGCQGLVRAGEGWTLVVDFGAGTTDLVLGRIFNRGSDQLLGEVRAYGERYGGADFDLLLAQHAAAELGVQLDPALLARWKLEAQRWKEAFSDAAQYDAVAETGFSFPVPTSSQGCDFRPVVLNRPTFGRIAGELVERFRSVLERGLRHFGAASGEVTQVVLTGGGAQWYFVEEAVRELLPGAQVIGGVEPVRAVARGLALAPALPQLLEAPARSLAPARTSPPTPIDDLEAERDLPDVARVGAGVEPAPTFEPEPSASGEPSAEIISHPIEAKPSVQPTPPPRNRHGGVTVGLILLLLFAWKVWPTPYAEVRKDGVVVPDKRTNRFTGRQQTRVGKDFWVDGDLKLLDPENKKLPVIPGVRVNPLTGREQFQVTDDVWLDVNPASTSGATPPSGNSPSQAAEGETAPDRIPPSGTESWPKFR